MKPNQIVISGKYIYQESNLVLETKNIKLYRGYDKSTKKDIQIRVIECAQQNLQEVFKSLIEIKSIKHLFITNILQLTRPEKQKIILVTEMSSITSLSQALKSAHFLMQQHALMIFKYILLGLREVQQKGSTLNILCLENIDICKYAMIKVCYNNLIQIPKFRKAPEIFQGKENTIESDIYSLGIILYQMLNGCPPFNEQNSAQLINQIKQKRYNKIERKSPLHIVTSKQSTYLIESMLDYYPQNRPTIQSILENISINKISIDTQSVLYTKPKVSLAPEQMQKKYLVFRSTKTVIDHFNYFKETKYLAFNIETKKFTNFIVPEYKLLDNKQSDVEAYNQKLKMFLIPHSNSTDLIVHISDFAKFKNEFVIIEEYSNQGNLLQYLNRRKNTIGWIQPQETNFIMYLITIGLHQIQRLGIDTLTSLLISKIDITDHKIRIREPSFINNSIQKKLKENFMTKDYYAPELKQPLDIADLSRSDIWAFGMIYYYCLTGNLAQFDNQQNLIQDVQLKTNKNIQKTIKKCLQVNCQNRIKLNKITIDDFDKEAVEEILGDVKQIEIQMKEKVIIKRQKRQRSSFLVKKKKSIFRNYNKILDESSTKLTRIGVKIFMVISFLLTVYFGVFIENAGNNLIKPGYFKEITIRVPKNYGTQLYNLTILANNGSLIRSQYKNYSYQQFKKTLRCWENVYDSSSKSTVSDFMYGGTRVALDITGFIFILLFCIYKGLQLYHYDLPNNMMQYNRHKEQKLMKWNCLITWVLSELLMSCLLFAHFFIFYFQYVQQSYPCLGIQNLAYPRFSSLYYLVTGKSSQYFQYVFLTVILLSILAFISLFCFVVFKGITNKMLEYKIYIFLVVFYLVFFFVCRVGFGNNLPLEPTFSYKFNRDILSVYYGFLGLFPELFILAILVLEFVVDFVFWLFLRVGINLQDEQQSQQSQEQQIEEIELNKDIQLQHFDLNMKPDNNESNQSSQFNLPNKQLESQIQYY